MNKNHKNAFTITEILLVVVVIGIITILILPGLLRDIHTKSSMSLLKATVIGVDDVVHEEITASHTDDIASTKIFTNTGDFLAKFDTADSGEPFAGAYSSYNGGAAAVTIPNNGVLLKNGVGIGVVNKLMNKNSTGIIVDVTGSKPPNIVGVDYFVFEIAWESDEENGVHVGDAHAYYNGGVDLEEGAEETSEGLKAACLGGNGAACYRLVELSGFAHDYLGELIRRKNMKKFGFTLTEILISLSILGIIAVLTVPPLLNDIHTKVYLNQIKNVSATLEQLAADQLITKKTRNLADTDFASAGTLFTERHFAIVNNSGLNGISYKSISGDDYTLDNINGSSVLLKNGVILVYAPAVNNGVAGTFIADVNGVDGPNTVGKDLFEFDITRQGQIVPGTDDTSWATCSAGAPEHAMVISKLMAGNIRIKNINFSQA